MTRLIRAVIHSSALRANLTAVKRFAPRARVLAVVKANAYGHGLVPTALALADADAFAVARLEEGMALRSAGVRTPIVLLEGVFNAPQLHEAAQHDFELVVHGPEQIALLVSWRGAHRFGVWIKIDSGMNRLGFRPEEFPAAYMALAESPAVAPRMRLLTHLANADVPDDPATTEQIALFQRTVTGHTLERSIANSAGILGWPASHNDWVRPGEFHPVNGSAMAVDGPRVAQRLWRSRPWVTATAIRATLRTERRCWSAVRAPVSRGACRWTWWRST